MVGDGHRAVSFHKLYVLRRQQSSSRTIANPSMAERDGAKMKNTNSVVKPNMPNLRDLAAPSLKHKFRLCWRRLISSSGDFMQSGAELASVARLNLFGVIAFFIRCRGCWSVPWAAPSDHSTVAAC
jgi:hypothetical protein